jgi:general secretion pathway protein D
MPQAAHMAAYPAGNILILSDRASNVHRLMRIIERLDQSGDEPIDVIALHNASAADVVRIITSLNQGAGAEGAGAAVKVVADERTNSILLTGEKSQRLRVKTLIVDMDTPLSSGGDTQVRYLRYADAEKIAEKLKGQASATAKAQGGPPSGPTPTGGGGSNVDASVTIWADIATNALIITAPPKIMRSLMQVIDKLDIRRAQVQVEALIVEVDVNKSSNLGVQWLLFGQGSGTVPAGVVNLPGAGTSIVDLAAAVLSGGAVGGAGSITTPITKTSMAYSENLRTERRTTTKVVPISAPSRTPMA